MEGSGVSFSSSVVADGGGGVSLEEPDKPARVAGTYEVEDDCFVKLTLELPLDGTAAVMHFRAILAAGGREALGIQSDPGKTVSLRLTAR